MIKDITIGQYYPSDSVIHHLDPRSKIIFSIIHMISLFCASNFYTYLFIIAMTLLVIKISKIPFRYILKGLKPIIILMVITLVINVLFTPGRTLFHWRFINVTYEGLELGIFMMIRLVLLIIGASILTLTTTPIQLTDAIEKLLSPLKKIGVPAHELAMMMTIALRFIPTLLDEADKIMKAQKARGADFESKKVIQRAKNMIPLLVPLFISAFRRADELAMAMESRCYHGGDGRTRMKVITFSKIDFNAMIMVFFYVAIVIGMEYLIK